jgi:hypothetical protein
VEQKLRLRGLALFGLAPQLHSATAGNPHRC